LIVPESIRFVQITHPPASGRAVQTDVANPDAAAGGFVAALVPASCEREWKPKHEAFLGKESVLSIASRKLRLHHRPGRAVLIGSPDRFADVLAAVIEFEQSETELRRIEDELDRTEADAERDLPLFFDVRTTEHRSMLVERMEHFSRLRLQFARLNRNRDLSPRSRAWLEQLQERAGTEDRAEAVSERLELREELYEGAADRAADAAGWAHGHRLEVIIIALLVVEIVFMSAELWLHFHE
jgi:hypothetical protein